MSELKTNFGYFRLKRLTSNPNLHDWMAQFHTSGVNRYVSDWALPGNRPCFELMLSEAKEEDILTIIKPNHITTTKDLGAYLLGLVKDKGLNVHVLYPALLKTEEGNRDDKFKEIIGMIHERTGGIHPDEGNGGGG